MAEPRLYSAEDFRRRVAARLAFDGSAVGDHSFNPEIADALLKIERKQAAVLVPVIHREPEATLLFTERTGGLRAHAGQISFPGGRIDPEDAGPEDAAVREAGEEIGLDPNFIETLGRGPDYLTGSGYHVALVVAVVRPGFSLQLNPAEVADAFEVPLSFLMDPVNHKTGSRVWNGARRTFYEMPFENHRIWGITAGMVRILYERLYADPSAERVA
jgi:8-oxo-dGTP pyrophosphatase MutT (NUDIX family)